MHMAEVIDFLLKNRIPGMFQLRRNVVDGGLMSYGTSSADLFRRGARYVDKILHGANPGDLPIEQPVSFGLVVNMKTARAIGLEIPASVLARADEVIE
jgi:putative ABC transport system substrate-binding protein